MRLLSPLVLLAIALTVGCSSTEDESSGELFIASEGKRFNGTFRFDPREPIVGQNRIALSLSDANDARVSGASIEVEGKMPSHGHSLGTAPTVEDRGDGEYSLNDVVYTMPGIWELTVHVATDVTSDTFAFDFDVR